MTEDAKELKLIDPQRARALFLCLDGLRYACGICAASYERVLVSLKAFEATATQRMEVPEHDAMLTVADIWSVVDSAYRARIIAARTPHLKRLRPDYEIFERNTRPIDAMRNYIQHLDTEISRIGDESTPLWGSISWQGASDPRTAFTLIAGNKLFKQSYVSLVYDTLEHRFVRPIELVVGKETLDINQVAQSVARLNALLIAWAKTFELENGAAYSYEPQSVPLFKITAEPGRSS